MTYAFNVVLIGSGTVCRQFSYYVEDDDAQRTKKLGDKYELKERKISQVKYFSNSGFN